MGVGNPIVLPLKARCPDCLPICPIHSLSPPSLLLPGSSAASAVSAASSSNTLDSSSSLATAEQQMCTCACTGERDPRHQRLSRGRGEGEDEEEEELDEEADEASLQSSGPPPPVSAEAYAEVQRKLRGERQKRRAQEAMALHEITKLIPPGVAQRGGQGNVHTPKEDHAPPHEGFADKLKHKVLGKKKE